MKLSRIIIGFVLSASLNCAFANEAAISIVGTESVSIAAKQPVYIYKTVRSQEFHKPILLQRIKLTAKAKQHIVNELETIDDATIPLIPLQPVLPSQVKLGMNNIPVLDQGSHGTCVTFATTAALDAVYSKGDYISQLCNLSLGSYLEKISANSYPSGWEGSSNYLVFNQIKQYGILSKNYQQTVGCAGVTEYPLIDADNIGYALSAEEFTAHSEPIMANMSVIEHLTMDDAFSSNVNMNDVLYKVKQALTNQHRVLIGFLLDPSDGDVGSFGTYKTTNDSWVVTAKITRHFQHNTITAGHAIIVTGYDDHAEIRYGKKMHKGVLTLRNSWSDAAGDHGEYYMSYDYFKTLAGEVIELVPN